jgi:hypothetical protein
MTSWSDLKQIGKQFAKEFCFPLACAIAYSLYVQRWPTPTFGRALADFGLAFFFVSWFSGNVVRIWRTDKTQAALKQIQTALANYEAASSKASEANSALLQETATAIRREKPGVKPDPLVELARLSAQANNELASANNAVMNVISSTLTPGRIVLPPGAVWKYPVEVAITGPIVARKDNSEKQE